MSVRLVDPETFVSVKRGLLISCSAGMAGFGILAACSGSRLVRRAFTITAAVHLAEAALAYDRARRAGFHASAGRWAAQTLAVGFPSLIALQGARERAAAAALRPSVGWDDGGRVAEQP